jgi:hypothetical protein
MTLSKASFAVLLGASGLKVPFQQLPVLRKSFVRNTSTDIQGRRKIVSMRASRFW